MDADVFCCAIFGDLTVFLSEELNSSSTISLSNSAFKSLVFPETDRIWTLFPIDADVEEVDVSRVDA